MSTLGKAVISFMADTVGFRGDVGKAVHIFESGVGKMLKMSAGLKTTLAGGLTIGGVVAFGKAAIDTADEVGKLAGKLGLQTEAVSELKHAYELGDGSQESFAKGLKEFNKSLVEATNGSSRAGRVFKALGVDISAGPQKAFRQFADAIAVLPEELRASTAEAVMGKSGFDWLDVLVKGSRGFDEAAERARELGIVISDDFAKRAERFKDNMKIVERSVTGFANTALQSGILEVLDDLSSRLEKAARKGELLKEVGGIIARVGTQALANSGSTPELERRLERYQAEDAYGGPGPVHMGQLSKGKIRGLRKDDGRSLTGSLFTPDPAAVRAALAESEALQKRQVAALQQMEERRKSLFDLSEQEIMIERIRTGTYKEFDAQTKVRLLNLALEIDLRKQHVQRIEAGIPALQAEAQAMERAGEMQRDFIVGGRQLVDQLKFEVDLVGRTSREQEKMVAFRQIDLELRRRQAELARAMGEDADGFARENAKLEAQAQLQREAAIRGIDARQRKEREWATGTKSAFDNYVENATNAAAQAEMLFSNAFQNMEDALVDFVKTGKLDFRSLADSIITDLIRIQVRQSMARMVGGNADVLGGIGSLFFPGGDSGSPGAYTGDAAAFAMGGIMTANGPLPLRRYASGGVARSPQLAMFGEGSMAEAFVPLPDGRRIPVAMEGRGASGSTYVIDARGADAEGLRRLEAQIRALDGAIEHRAVSAALNVASRGGSAARRLRG